MKIFQWSNSEKENQSMVQLIENEYGKAEIKNLSYINWQYIKNPQGKAIIPLCYDEEKDDLIIGQEPIIPSAPLGFLPIPTSDELDGLWVNQLKRAVLGGGPYLSIKLVSNRFWLR